MRTSIHGLTAIAVIGSSSVITIGSNTATAQQVDADETVIVSTARRREESFQDVPIAITAFSEAEIEAAGILGLAEALDGTFSAAVEAITSRISSAPITAGPACGSTPTPTAGNTRPN